MADFFTNNAEVDRTSIYSVTFSEESNQLDFIKSGPCAGYSAVDIENSSEIIIGPVTQYHGPVTIYKTLKCVESSKENNTEDEGVSDKKEISTLHSNDNKIKDIKEQGKLVKTDSTASEKQQEKVQTKLLPLRIYFKRITVLYIFTFIGFVTCIIAAVGFYEEISRTDRISGCGDTESCVCEAEATLLQFCQTKAFNCNLNVTELIKSRSDWGGFVTPNSTKLSHPVSYVIISHTGTGFCTSSSACSAIIRGIQKLHVASGNSDIGYNFLIDGAGNIYTARGWFTQNFHMPDSIGISFIGDFEIHELSPPMTNAALTLLISGLTNGYLHSHFKLVGHNQTMSTLSPGRNVYKIIKEWPHYYPGPIHLTFNTVQF